MTEEITYEQFRVGQRHVVSTYCATEGNPTMIDFMYSMTIECVGVDEEDPYDIQRQTFRFIDGHDSLHEGHVIVPDGEPYKLDGFGDALFFEYIEVHTVDTRLSATGELFKKPFELN